eukprot:CAMPEP_0180330254 /NCGR_PEP_ID=MMETSP0988-20121125/41232_1 /TAXON_ID=697907 /ORGANISM="non described non described, Strain CCMP2293" /LENGTH=78 /DNA_ID=CAMNT_0022317483 /DNA_START=339 /DNA_END=572 /DNA_ORIENTATION=-
MKRENRVAALGPGESFEDLHALDVLVDLDAVKLLRGLEPIDPGKRLRQNLEVFEVVGEDGERAFRYQHLKDEPEEGVR